MKASNKHLIGTKLYLGGMPDMPSDNACIFSHFSKTEEVADYVFHYLEKLVEAGCDIVFVSTSNSLPKHCLQKLEKYCAVVVIRENHGYDFGSYKFGIDLITELLPKYSRLILCNDSVYGPFKPLNEIIHHGDNTGLDIWGATDSYGVRYHIQSYFMVYSQKVLADEAFDNFWGKVSYAEESKDMSKHDIIDNYEVGGSTQFIDKGFRLGAFCSILAIKNQIVSRAKETLKNDPGLLRMLLSNVSIKHNPTHFYWDILIEQYGLPFIKRELLQVNPVQMQIDNWRDVIRNTSDYDIKLIESHILHNVGMDFNHLFDWFFEDVDTPAGQRTPYFLTQLLTIWPDLEAKLDIQCNTEDGLLNTIAYWEAPLRNNSPDIRWPSQAGFPAFVSEPAEGVTQDAVLPITKGAMAVLRTRPDLQTWDMGTPMGRKQFNHWRLTLGQTQYRFLALTPTELAHLLAPCEAFGGRLKHLPNMAMLLPVFHTVNPSLLEKLTKGDVDAYNHWWPLYSADLMQTIDQPTLPIFATKQSLEPTHVVGTFKPDGINIIGLPNGQFGIGEDARTATRAMLRAGFETTVCPAPISIASTVSNAEWTDEYVRPAPVAKTNLICLPAADTFQLLMKEWAPVLAGRYNICAWQWELPKWPTHWSTLLNIPDEIWAQSKYVQTMFQEATDKPVTYMPLAIDRPIYSPQSKAYFGIPENSFAFLSVFDCNSWIRRKNPIASVRAFIAAFPKERTDVRLVIKLMNPRAEVADYQELLRHVAQDPRVLVIDRFLSRSDMLALIACCDVFMSLHRSEGFGRVVAEAMYLGRPVISTNFSGSVDFAHKETAYVIDGPMVALKPGDYVDHAGQFWMDPDVGMAADAMKSCIDQPERTALLANAGKRQILDNHTVLAVAVRYLNRLKALGVN